MNARGWYCGRTTRPRGIHMMCTPVHEPVAAAYVADIARCLAEARAAAGPAAGRAVY